MDHMGTAAEDTALAQRPNLAAGDMAFFAKFKREFTISDVDAIYVLFYASLAGQALSGDEILNELNWRSCVKTLEQRLRKIAGKLTALRTGYEVVATGYNPQLWIFQATLDRRWIFQATLDRRPRELCCWDIRIKPDGTQVIVPLPGVHVEDFNFAK
jgi:hypothetical protein